MICGEMSMINAAYAALIFSISAAASLMETLMNAHMCVWQYQNATFGNQKCNYQYQPGLPH
jgi:thiaminase